MHRGRGVGGGHRGVEDGQEWNYDTVYLETQIYSAIYFMHTYDVPVAAIEFGLRLGGYGSATQSRLDCQNYKFWLMHNTGSYHWTYWELGGIENPFYADYTPNQVGDQLLYWIVNSPP